MTITEIKKELYRQNMEACFIQGTKEYLLYRAQSTIPQYFQVNFLIPRDDMGETVFECLMPAKHLIRYIVTPENA